MGLVMALGIPAALARTQAAPDAQKGEGKHMGMRDKLQETVDSLNLTDDQKAKVKDIFADAKTKHKALAADASLNDEQKRAKMKEIREDTLSKINEVLTPEQQTELKNKMSEAKTKTPTQP